MHRNKHMEASGVDGVLAFPANSSKWGPELLDFDLGALGVTAFKLIDNFFRRAQTRMLFQ